MKVSKGNMKIAVVQDLYLSKDDYIYAYWECLSYRCRSKFFLKRYSLCLVTLGLACNDKIEVYEKVHVCISTFLKWKCFDFLSDLLDSEPIKSDFALH